MRRHRSLMARLCLLADRSRRSHDGLHNAGTDRTIAWSAECWRSAPVDTRLNDRSAIVSAQEKHREIIYVV